MSRGYRSGGGNMQNLMKQMQKTQKQMEDVQKKVEEKEFSATSGGGVVEVKMNGKREVLGIEIDPDALDPDDVDMLQDMLTVAFNDCLKQVQEYSDSEMGKITGGLNIPGL